MINIMNSITPTYKQFFPPPYPLNEATNLIST
jgi:hypothetical protein